MLSADVLGAHEHDAGQIEEGACGRRGDAVLACAGLGDDPVLAETFELSRAWPRALLILWAPVCARSSRLRYSRSSTAAGLGHPPQRRGPPEPRPSSPRPGDPPGRSAWADRSTMASTRRPSALRRMSQAGCRRRSGCISSAKTWPYGCPQDRQRPRPGPAQLERAGPGHRRDRRRPTRASPRRPHAPSSICPSVVFMGAEDIRRQQPNVLRMRALGTEVRPVTSGSATSRTP